MITVITVVLNASNTIIKTIESVLKQEMLEFHYIIVDGGSCDGTKEIIDEIVSDYHGSIKIYFFSEPDKGIYDAMNKGISRAEGEYIYFLNAGDYFVDSKVLFDCEHHLALGDFGIICGNVVFNYRNRKQNFNYYKHHRLTPFFFGWGINTCHQAVFVKTSILKAHNFDTSFILLADQEMLAYAIRYSGKIKYINRYIAEYDPYGYSSKSKEQSRKEMDRINRKYNRLWYLIFIIPKYLTRKLTTEIKDE